VFEQSEFQPAATSRTSREEVMIECFFSWILFFRQAKKIKSTKGKNSYLFPVAF
jgi:hypothetical protein